MTSTKIFNYFPVASLHDIILTLSVDETNNTKKEKEENTSLLRFFKHPLFEREVLRVINRFMQVSFWKPCKSARYSKLCSEIPANLPSHIHTLKLKENLVLLHSYFPFQIVERKLFNEIKEDRLYVQLLDHSDGSSIKATVFSRICYHPGRKVFCCSLLSHRGVVFFEEDMKNQRWLQTPGSNSLELITLDEKRDELYVVFYDGEGKRVNVYHIITFKLIRSFPVPYRTDSITFIKDRVILGVYDEGLLFLSREGAVLRKYEHLSNLIIRDITYDPITNYLFVATQSTRHFTIVENDIFATPAYDVFD